MTNEIEPRRKFHALTPEEVEKIRKFIIGALSSAAVIVATRLFNLLLESDSVSQAIVYLLTNYPFFGTVLIAASTSGYFAQKWTTHRRK